MKKMKLKAMAKINLGLDVIRKREDGYHEVRMIMQTVGIYDRITLSMLEEPGIRVKTNLFYLPSNEDNLVYKAAKLLTDEFGLERGVRIDLHKYIPVAAGMAGGSSDAAAVLVGMNRMFRLGLTRQQLMERGVKLGADIPYCILRGTALAEGIGEELTPLPAVPRCHVVIAKPAAHISTKFVYQNLKADALPFHPDIDGQIGAIRDGDLKGMAALMGNVLETVTIPACPVIREVKERMLADGALNAMMSGSGPTVFGIFNREEKARAACRHLRESGAAKQVYLTGMFNGGNANAK